MAEGTTLKELSLTGYMLQFADDYTVIAHKAGKKFQWNTYDEGKTWIYQGELEVVK